MCYRSIFNASIMPINTPYNVLYDLMNNCNHRYNTYLSQLNTYCTYWLLPLYKL